jgi:thiamine-phosphate pyrophosphorylase
LTVFSIPTVYPIIDTSVCERHALEPVTLADAYLRGGATVVQLRDKTGGSAGFLDLARRLVRLAGPVGARIIVNDRADIAVLAGAAGVHVGQDDLGVEEVRRVRGFAGAVGLSTHSAGQVDAARALGVAYLAVGPVYGSVTKDTGYTARGLDLVRYASRFGTPVVAIGGITLGHIPELVAAGATGLAVISDLLSTGNPEGRVREYVSALGRLNPS